MFSPPLVRLVTALCLLFAVVPATAQEEEPNQVYRVDRVELSYAVDHPGLPAPSRLLEIPLELSRAERAWVRPVPGLPTEAFTIGELYTDEMVLGPSAIAEIGRRIVGELNGRGLIGVYVAPHPEDIDTESGADLRGGRNALRMQIWVGRAQKVRTTAAGYGVGDRNGADRDREQRLLELSPIQPGAEDGRDLMRREPLEEYIFRINRHPRRETRLALTAGADPATVNLEYQVFYERPWTIYGETSNTGTDNTGKTRNRLGFVHYQATGNDDVLRLDYVTGKFDGDVAALSGSYEFPIRLPGIESDRLRLNLSGGWSKFRADQFALPQDFKGTQSEAGIELVANVFQSGRLFVDVFAGTRWQNIDIDNGVNPSADANFILPRVGVRMERSAATWGLFASVSGQGHYASQSEIELVGLGRTPVEDRAVTLSWAATLSAYLEPFLFPGRSANLAHELMLSTRGQWAFDSRLIPQHQQVAGGLYSVRGYPQAASSGDSVVLATLEYRLHLPRLLAPGGAVNVPLYGAFQLRPPRAGARPDWDFIVRAFYDYGRTVRNDSLSFESNERLSAIGLGAELVLRNNLRGRLDCGWALSPLRSARVGSGDRECNVSAAYLF